MFSFYSYAFDCDSDDAVRLDSHIRLIDLDFPVSHPPIAHRRRSLQRPVVVQPRPSIIILALAFCDCNNPRAGTASAAIEMDALAAVAPLHVHGLPMAALVRRIPSAIDYSRVVARRASDVQRTGQVMGGGHVETLTELKTLFLKSSHASWQVTQFSQNKRMHATSIYDDRHGRNQWFANFQYAAAAAASRTTTVPPPPPPPPFCATLSGERRCLGEPISCFEIEKKVSVLEVLKFWLGEAGEG